MSSKQAAAERRADAPRIVSMTSAQTRRACDAALTLTKAWLRRRRASDCTYGGARAYADLEVNRYVAVVGFSYTTTGGRHKSGEITWMLDGNFSVLGKPEVQARNTPAVGKKT